jgi:hypothetical protein
VSRIVHPINKTSPQELTRHEIRLRAPFDPLPYSALADACERFFDYLIAVRQAALFYNPGYIRDNPVASEKLLGYRRDAVAAILGNLYILAGALRSQRKVPVCELTIKLHGPAALGLLFGIIN